MSPVNGSRIPDDPESPDWLLSRPAIRLAEFSAIAVAHGLPADTRWPGHVDRLDFTDDPGRPYYRHSFYLPAERFGDRAQRAPMTANGGRLVIVRERIWTPGLPAFVEWTWWGGEKRSAPPFETTSPCSPKTSPPSAHWRCTWKRCARPGRSSWKKIPSITDGSGPRPPSTIAATGRLEPGARPPIAST
jgi:hypothetical protein